MIIEIQENVGQELIKAAEHDTAVRIELEKDGALFDGYHPIMRSVHEKNADLLTKFIDSYGWPAPSKWGQEIHEAAWLIAIHTISRPDVLRRALHELKRALDDGELVAEQYARLFDRIALYEGRQQEYGTQFFPNENGKWYARDLDSVEKAEERRLAIGMISFEQNQKEVNEWAATLPTVPPPINEEKFLQFLIEVGWRNQDKNN